VQGEASEEVVAMRFKVFSCKCVSVGLLAAVIFGGGHHQRLFADDLADLKARGELVMLCSPHSRSDFIRRDGEGFVGLDYEIMKTFAAAHDLKLRVVPVPKFSDLIPWLIEGKGDVIASSFSITDERSKEVDFSVSYFPVRIMVVAKRSSGIISASDLSGLRATVVPGSSLEAFIKTKIPDVEMVHIASLDLVSETIESGKADYAPVDSSTVFGSLKRFSSLETAFSFPDTFGYGFAVTKGADLHQALSTHIDRLRSSGIYYKMIQRIFGNDAVEMIKAAEPRN
jgi:ABC-type amino acid transport substrate-binding protein